MPDAAAVAKFMADELKANRYLYRDPVTLEVVTNFGKQYTEINVYGNLAVRRDIIDEFYTLVPDVVYEVSGRLWRRRKQYDEPGRLQP